MWNLKYDTNELIYEINRITDIENRLVVASGEGLEWEVGVSRCKFLYTEWISKVLLYSAENYIYYLMINHNGKEYKKKNVYIYV